MKKSNLYLTIWMMALTAIAPYSLSAQDMVTAVGQEGLEKTVSFDIASFTDVRNDKLEDVLKKMPGITEVTWEGAHSYKYNGMDIEKIYVNGMDILEGNYEPVYNMKLDDVERLEFTENHVSIKVMKGIQYSNKVSINVVLKEHASSKWSGTMEGGLGVTPLLVNADMNAINIGSKMQSTVLFKADNTGLDFSGPLTGFGGFDQWGMETTNTPSGIDFTIKKLLNVEPTLAPLAPERVRFNRSGIANVGSTLKLNDDYQLNFKLIYHTDRLRAESFDETIYYLSQGEQVVDITGEDAKSHRHDIQADITLLTNTEKRYLRNQLSLATQWNDVSKNIIGTFPNDQKAETKPMLVKDDFILTQHLGKNILTLNMNTGLYVRPQNLDVRKEDGQFLQKLNANSAYAELGATLSNKVNDRLTLAYNVGATGNLRHMDVTLKGLQNFSTPDIDSRVSVLNAFAGVTMTYITDKMQAEVKVPAKTGHYNMKDKVTGLDKSKSEFYVGPTFDIKFMASENLSLALNGKFSLNEPQRMNLYPSMVFNDFRTATRGIPSIKNGTSSFGTLNVQYSHPKSSLFVNGNLTYWRDKMVFIPIMEFTDDYIINGYLEEDTYWDGWESNLDISKGIESLKGKIGLRLRAEINNLSMVRNESLIPFTNNIYTVSPYINGRLTSWWNVIYTLEFNADRVKMKDEDTSTKSKSYTQKLEMIFSPSQRLNFSVLAEHYYTQFMDDVSKHLILWDTQAEYDITSQWQVILSVKNILNQKTYNYTLSDHDNFTKSYTAYKIRPRNILISLFYKF